MAHSSVLTSFFLGCWHQLSHDIKPEKKPTTGSREHAQLSKLLVLKLMFHDTHIILAMTDTLHWKLGTLIAQTSHGVPEARPDTWTPESQWLWSHSCCCRVASHFSPCWYWWPVGGIATTSIQPIRDLQFMQQFMQSTQKAQPAGIKNCAQF